MLGLSRKWLIVVVIIFIFVFLIINYLVYVMAEEFTKSIMAFLDIMALLTGAFYGGKKIRKRGGT